jgi:hypothetical protein
MKTPQILEYREPAFNTVFEKKMKVYRLSIALGISISEVNKLFLNRNDIICRRMKNNIRANRKQFVVTSRLTKDSFMHLLAEDENFNVLNWGCQLNVAGNLEKGWNFQITGNHLYYAN